MKSPDHVLCPDCSTPNSARAARKTSPDPVQPYVTWRTGEPAQCTNCGQPLPSSQAKWRWADMAWVGLPTLGIILAAMGKIPVVFLTLAPVLVVVGVLRTLSRD